MKRVVIRYFSSGLVKNFSWNLLGNLVSKGAVFVTSLLAANLLGTENFGRIGIIQQTTGMMIAFSVMGLSQTAILFVGRNLKSSNAVKQLVVKRIMQIGIVTVSLVCLIYFTLINYIAIKVFGDSNLIYLLKICSLVLLASSINQIQFGVLSGLGKFNKVAFTNIFVGFLSIPLTYFLMKELGVQGFIWALVVNGWITLLFNKYFIYKEIERSNEEENKSKSFLVPSYKNIINYASSNVLGAILFTTSTWFALGVMTRKAGLVDVAAFNASMQVFSILYLAPSMLAQVLMSFVSQGELLREQLNKIIKITFLLVSISGIVLSFFSSDLLSLYNDDLRVYSSVLNWVLAIVTVASVINLLDHYANGLGMVKIRIVSHIVFAFFYTILTVLLVDSAVSLVQMLFFAYLIRAVVLYYLLHSKLRWF